MNNSEVLDVVYYIEGMVGNTLDTFVDRAKAIREYITEYKARKVDARICMVQHGIKYYFEPSGTVADYH